MCFNIKQSNSKFKTVFSPYSVTVDPLFSAYTEKQWTNHCRQRFDLFRLKVDAPHIVVIPSSLIKIIVRVSENETFTVTHISA